MKLKITELSKTYKNGVKALDHVNLEIGAGMFGLLGPNGAGKSTLMRTIATLQKPDSGAINFDGINVLESEMELRKVLGYLPQEFGVYPNMSAKNLLDYFARLKGIASSKERDAIVKKVLEVTNLYDQRNKHVSGYSGGMKQRFGIAQLLLNNPKLIIVDEPTAGLDPLAAEVLKEKIIKEKEKGKLILITSHLLSELDDLITEIIFMQEGKVHFHQKVEELKATTGEEKISKAIAKILKNKQNEPNH